MPKNLLFLLLVFDIFRRSCKESLRVAYLNFMRKRKSALIRQFHFSSTSAYLKRLTLDMRKLFFVNIKCVVLTAGEARKAKEEDTEREAKKSVR